MEEKGPKNLIPVCYWRMLAEYQVLEETTYPLLIVYSFCLYFQGTYLKLNIILAI